MKFSEDEIRGVFKQVADSVDKDTTAYIHCTLDKDNQLELKMGGSTKTLFHLTERIIAHLFNDAVNHAPSEDKNEVIEKVFRKIEKIPTDVAKMMAVFAFKELLNESGVDIESIDIPDLLRGFGKDEKGEDDE